MKKLLIVALSVMVSACACFECEREAQMASYPETRMAQPDCDYFDGKTCYRYVYRNTQRPVAKPAARRSACLYGQKAKSPCGCQQVKGSCGCGNSCETKISETKAVKITVPTMAETVKEIDTQTTEMNTTDYSDALKSLNEAYTALNNSVKQYELVNNPAESYVIKCLEKVEHVTGISAVTEDNDPNGHLGKAGGYTATVYFTCDWVNQANVIGDTIIDKGTDGGGAIEVYANVEDAESRNEYLAGFDGGVLASGSHIVVGTCVVRTSDELAASKQKELEAAVIEALTKLE